MKIRFRKVTNIRSDHQSLSADPLGVLYAGSLVEVDGVIHKGASIKGDNRWWRDLNGWYYWAGETETIMTDSAGGVGAIPTPVVTPAPAPSPSAPVFVPSASPPETERPPVAAIELIALPVPDENLTHGTTVPEGEWRWVDEHILPNPPAPSSESSDLESFSMSPQNLPPELLRPQVKRLNWGLLAGQIPSHWWQEKRLTGRGVTLAILSTGVDAQHPDLKGASSTILANIIENEAFGDSHGLGTQAAIVAAGKGRIAYGVAPEVKLLIGKIGSTPNNITPEILMTGLEWAIAQKADVAALLVDFIELSNTQKKQLTEVIARALDANIVLLAPVGNSSARKPENRFPAALEGVISVGSHQSSNRRSGFSAKSSQLDFLAPGEGLKTSIINQGFRNNLKNTAIATAFAAGFVALLKQWEKDHHEAYSPADIIAFLRETAYYDGVNKGKDTEMGYGILNPEAVLEKLMK